MRTINEIIIHCSATNPDWWAGKSTVSIRNEFNKWHKAKGWKGIGYHIVIGRDGTVASGRPIEQVGAHTKGHNAHSIGVCLVGGTPTGKATDKFSDHFTKKQDATLRKILSDYGDSNPTLTKISGHNQYAAKGCPAFNVQEWLLEESNTELPKKMPAGSPVVWIISVATAVIGWIVAKVTGLF